MSSLRETQRAFRDAVLGSGAAVPLDRIAADGLTTDARLAIYRHHVTATLTDVLEAVYPVVCRLVDERFFSYAAERFIAAHPPTSPCLSEYGEAFAGFLATFGPCRSLAYLPDVARLEWAMSRALYADDAPLLDGRTLRDCPASEISGLRLRLHPSLSLIHSRWPIDRIWRANQPDADPTTLVDLSAGAARLAVRRHGDDVVLRTLGAGAYALRRALHEGRTLGETADIALAEDPALDLTAALLDLFADESLVGFTLTTSHKEDAA